MERRLIADKFFVALWLLPSAVSLLLSISIKHSYAFLGFGFFWLIFGIVPWAIHWKIKGLAQREQFWTPMKVRTGRLLVLAAGLTVAHFYYDYSVGYRLFELRGGVRKMPNGWTNYGGVDRAWTIPTHLPFCVIARITDKLDAAGLAYLRWILAPIGLVSLLAPSPLAGWVLASLIMAVCRREKPLLGGYFWRLWLMLLSWGWILVPAELSHVWFYTVQY